VADEFVERVLGLPAGLRSTSVLGGAGLDEVVEILDLSPGQVLLDLACGRGGYGREIARRTGCRLAGVDFSAVAIAQARDSGGDFRVGTMSATGLDATSVDAVLVVDAYQFAEPKLDALRECLRVLRPGGRLVITTWEPADATDERLPVRLRQIDLAAQLPAAGFVDAEVVGTPEWRALENTFWQESLALDAGDDLAVRSMPEEARRVPAVFHGRRRVLATVTAPPR
jgi:SAM-dependent methyltransferase